MLKMKFQKRDRETVLHACGGDISAESEDEVFRDVINAEIGVRVGGGVRELNEMFFHGVDFYATSAEGDEYDAKAYVSCNNEMLEVNINRHEDVVVRVVEVVDLCYDDTTTKTAINQQDMQKAYSFFQLKHTLEDKWEKCGEDDGIEAVLDAGVIIQDNRTIGTVFGELRHGYHPSYKVRVFAGGQVLKTWYELYEEDLKEKIEQYARDVLNRFQR